MMKSLNAVVNNATFTKVYQAIGGSNSIYGVRDENGVARIVRKDTINADTIPNVEAKTCFLAQVLRSNKFKADTVGVSEYIN